MRDAITSVGLGSQITHVDGKTTGVEMARVSQ